MAKRKTPKTVDLKPQLEKISKDELARVQALVHAINEGRNQLGSLEMQKHGILHEVGMINQEISKFQKEMKEKYGSSNINVANGEITPEENEQADS
jgi:hypothetical protein|tara:strand:+ start:59 stop:346 length:288 start_codon:yes stop_codon:yes gene_type:complete